MIQPESGQCYSLGLGLALCKRRLAEHQVCMHPFLSALVGVR